MKSLYRTCGVHFNSPTHNSLILDKSLFYSPPVFQCVLFSLITQKPISQSLLSPITIFTNLVILAVTYQNCHVVMTLPFITSKNWSWAFRAAMLNLVNKLEGKPWECQRGETLRPILPRRQILVSFSSSISMRPIFFDHSKTYFTITPISDYNLHESRDPSCHLSKLSRCHDTSVYHIKELVVSL